MFTRRAARAVQTHGKPRAILRGHVDEAEEETLRRDRGLDLIGAGAAAIMADTHSCGTQNISLKIHAPHATLLVDNISYKFTICNEAIYASNYALEKDSRPMASNFSPFAQVESHWLRRSGWWLLAILLAALVGQSPANAQVNLPIPNIQQQTQTWCWAAVAEQIIRWKNNGQGPSQCELLSMANGLPPGTCCFPPPNPMVMQACNRTGALHEIQGMIAAFAHSMSMVAPPAHPIALFETLQGGHPIILAVQSSPFSGHVVVLRGMIMGPDPLLIINDPMGWTGFSQPVPFSQLIPMWSAAIVVQ